MHRGALLFALLFTASCKKQPPAGDLPPATNQPPAAPAATPPAPSGTPSVTATTRTEPANPTGGSGDTAGGDPHTLSVTTTVAKVPDKLPDGRLVLGPFSVAAPANWTATPPKMSMRVAQFELPAKPGAEAELVVFHFGAKGAGSIDDNLDRWLGQFQQPDGKSSREVAKIEKTQFGGQEATYVSVTGRFVAAPMPGAGGGPIDRPDQELLAAIVASPSGPYYFKLIGAKATVNANAKAFRGMLESLKLR